MWGLGTTAIHPSSTGDHTSLFIHPTTPPPCKATFKLFFQHISSTLGRVLLIPRVSVFHSISMCAVIVAGVFQVHRQVFMFTRGIKATVHCTLHPQVEKLRPVDEDRLRK